jgi:hypothetical protein
MALVAAGNLRGYSTGGGGSGPGGSMADLSMGDPSIEYWSLSKCKRGYSDYLASKRLEIEEQQESRRYRHASQWTSKQIEIFNERKQPVITFNRLGRKLDGIVGIVESLRREPKAYPRTPRYQASADLATAALRACLEQNKWKAKSPKCAETAAVDGIGGIELILEQRNGNYDVGFEAVDIDGFFYDPRSKKEDFSDATYMGMGKWIDVDVLIDAMPDKEQEIRNSVGSGEDLSSNSDGDANWFMTTGELKSVRLIYICYRHRGGWCWALFTGAAKLLEGKSYFVDSYGQPICSFIMFSAAVDHDNDR